MPRQYSKDELFQIGNWGSLPPSSLVKSKFLFDVEPGKSHSSPSNSSSPYWSSADQDKRSRIAKPFAWERTQKIQKDDQAKALNEQLSAKENHSSRIPGERKLEMTRTATGRTISYVTKPVMEGDASTPSSAALEARLADVEEKISDLYDERNHIHGRLEAEELRLAKLEAITVNALKTIEERQSAAEDRIADLEAKQMDAITSAQAAASVALYSGVIPSILFKTRNEILDLKSKSTEKQKQILDRFKALEENQITQFDQMRHRIARMDEIFSHKIAKVQESLHTCRKFLLQSKGIAVSLTSREELKSD